MKNWHEKTDTQMDTDYALGGGQPTKAQLYLHVLCNNCIGSSWVDETMGIRAEKWIGNMRGWSNQNVWRAASPFEVIRVDGSRKCSVIWRHGIPAQVVAVVVFFVTFGESRSSIVRQLRTLNHRKLAAYLLIIRTYFFPVVPPTSHL